MKGGGRIVRRSADGKAVRSDSRMKREGKNVCRRKCKMAEDGAEFCRKVKDGWGVKGIFLIAPVCGATPLSFGSRPRVGRVRGRVCLLDNASFDRGIPAEVQKGENGGDGGGDIQSHREGEQTEQERGDHAD